MKGPWRITFDTNPDDCNLRCIMCEEHSEYSSSKLKKGSRRVMEINLLERTVEELVLSGLREIIPSTMGEPLLYKDFDRILELVRNTGIKLNLTTNGSFPKKSVTEWAKLLIPISSDIKISWNGASVSTQEEIMRGISFEKKMENLKVFLEERERLKKEGESVCSVTLQMTFMKSNFKELPDLISLAADIGIERVKGHHLWAHSDIQEEWSLRSDEYSREEWNEIVRISRERAAEEEIRTGHAVRLENIELLSADLERDSVNKGECPFLGKEAWINTAGEIDVCCAPHSERRKLANFGSLKDRTLTEIWKSPEYRALLNTYKSSEICKRCNMRKKEIA